MPIEYRPARPEVYDEAGRVLVDAYRAAGLLPEGHAYALELADVAGRADRSEVVVAVEGGTVVGTVTFCPNGSSLAELSRPGEGEFRMLGVDPPHQGRGIGEELTRHCIARARELGYQRVLLSSRPHMTVAHRLYTRLGFVRAPELDWSPLPDVDLLGFRLDLSDN